MTDLVDQENILEFSFQCFHKTFIALTLAMMCSYPHSHNCMGNLLDERIWLIYMTVCR